MFLLRYRGIGIYHHDHTGEYYTCAFCGRPSTDLNNIFNQIDKHINGMFNRNYYWEFVLQKNHISR